MKFLDFPLEIKSVSDDGAFSGYGSVWDVVDRQYDVVRKGAFKEIVTNSDGRIVVLWQHMQEVPIATAKVSEDNHGLHFDGRLILGDPQARVAHAHMKAKSVRGVSIGYDAIDWKILSSGIRELTAIRLYELSLVTFPALPQAQVDTVKSFAACSDQRELKNLLREHGLSRNKAAAGADALWQILRGKDDDCRDAGLSPVEIKALADQLNTFTAQMKGSK